MSNAAICRSAKRLRAFVVFLMLVLGGSMAIALSTEWLGLTLGHVHVQLQQHNSLADSIAGSGLTVVLIEIALLRLTQMLSSVANGDYYSIGVVRHFRGFAMWLLIAGVVRILAGMVQPFTSGPAIMIGIDLQQALTVGLALLLFLLARLLERAREIEQENREII